MGLEHRWSPRKQVRMNALIFHRPLGLRQVKILDIGMEGVFIVGEQLTLPFPSIVTLSFAFMSLGKNVAHQIDAMVIHSNSGGYGLMFKDFQLGVLQTLKDSLYAA